MFRFFNRLPSVQTKGKRLFLKKTFHGEKYLVVSKTDQFSTEVGDYVVAANEKGLWKLGILKHVCPNVRRYKLQIFNYLQMFGSFRQTEQKYKRITNVQ
jgi:hypothetical protein